MGEAVALPGVNAVAVVTPPRSHRGIVLEAVGAGKHVMCEKPFALDLSEGRAMLDEAEGAGVVHLLGTEFRFATGQAQLARTIHAGVIGEPRHALFELQLPTHADPAAELPDWWQLESEGGGWLGAHGSHVVDQVRTTLGEIVGVSASLDCIADRPGMEQRNSTHTVSPGVFFGEYRWSLSPTEFGHRNVRVSPLPTPHQSPARLLQEFPECAVFCSDYAHNEGHPAPVTYYDDLLRDTAEDTRALFFGESIAECFARMGDPITIG